MTKASSYWRLAEDYQEQVDIFKSRWLLLMRVFESLPIGFLLWMSVHPLFLAPLEANNRERQYHHPIYWVTQGIEGASLDAIQSFFPFTVEPSAASAGAVCWVQQQSSGC